MKLILKFFFSIIFIFFCSFISYGQIERYVPTAVKIGADPGALGYMAFSKKRGFFEAEADIDIDRFFVVANYGLSSYQLEEETYSYENDGSYLKLGMDINFMQKDPHLNIAFFGLRYATSSFNDKLDYDTKAIIQSEIGWPSTRESVSNDQVKANWYEMVAGLKIRVVKQLYMGFTARFKFMKKLKQVESFRPYYIPGFGKNVNESAFGFNYYISYRLPFRKKIIYTDENNEVLEEK